MTWQVTWYSVKYTGTKKIKGRYQPTFAFNKEIGTSEFEDLNFNHKWGNKAPFKKRINMIGFRATTRVIPLSDKLEITIGSDNGSRLFFDDKEVIDNWAYRGSGHRRKTATIEAIPIKPAKLKYEWYEWGGKASAEFEADITQMQAIMGTFPLNLPFVAQAVNIVALPFDVFSLAINPNVELPKREKESVGAASIRDEEVEMF